VLFSLGREGLDALPGGDDGFGPWPAGRDLEDAAPSCVGEPRCGVQDAGSWARPWRLPSNAVSLSQASKTAAISTAASQALLMAMSLEGSYQAARL
jgi:hypothetical protein